MIASQETTVDRQIREAEEQHPEEMAKARAWVERQQRVQIGAANRGRRRMSKRYRRKEDARYWKVMCRPCMGTGNAYSLLGDVVEPCETCEGTGKR